jgi:glycine/D-amino acid oxidase-like deaminating enzyme
MCYKAYVNELPRSADVVIVGGGFAGAATAWALRRRGFTDIVIVEREPTLGRYASGRSAGLGRQLAEDDDTTALTVRGAQLLRELPEVWTHTGGVLTFDDDGAAAAYAARAQRFGVSAEINTPELVAARWPVLAYMRVTQALWVPGDGVIDVVRLLAVLTDGVKVRCDAAVQRIEPGPRPRVITARGDIAATVVVDASGAWAGATTGDAPLDAFKRHVFILDAQPTAAAPFLWHLGTGELYVRADPGGVLASPCDAGPCEPGDQDADLVGEAHLRRLLDAAGSDLAAAPITRRWACQRAYTKDRKMRVGRDPARPWLVWAAGLGGHGATAAPAVGERAAEAVIAALAPGSA